MDLLAWHCDAGQESCLVSEAVTYGMTS